MRIGDAMARNIVILLDGTSNEIASDRTNILRLFGTLRRSEEQIVYYDPGVGTFGADDAWLQSYRKAVEIWGLATGWGLDQNVKEAYRFLVETYRKAPRDADGKRIGEDDRIYIFGFSRGAYSARVLAGFIHALGLVEPHHLNLLDYAYNTYKGIAEHDAASATPLEDGASGENGNSAFLAMRLYERTLKAYRPAIKLLGLFDTVASVIEMGKWRPQFKTHPFTNRNPSVEWARHAVAIDEQRTMFHPQLWPLGQDYWGGPFKPKTIKPQDAKEVWFAGAHGDVGGGYKEAESGLIKIPLVWMIEETKPTGLQFNTGTVNAIVKGTNPDKAYVKPDPLGPMHRSMRKLWHGLEFLPRRAPATSWRRKGRKGVYLPLYDRRLIPADATVHQSVIDRKTGAPEGGRYDPPNLPTSVSIEPW
jgi:uncharacterized protein (DUF2235 family)